ncbi:MAG: dTDP-glucose 4,6-dehydratase [Planctomycetes bacterium]|nr:dTDP-glucose 4,6-dehydratase [Planctomycetota bacterium]
MRRILVTGGCGFIGSNFIHYMLKRHGDISIINLDLLTYAGNPENLKGIAKDRRYTFIKGDIADGKLVESILKRRVDAIVNFAAESHVDRSIHNPAVFLATNILGTQRLLESAMKYRVSRFLQISTDEVYGSLNPKEPAFTEKHHLEPSSPYSASKTSADLLVKAYEKTFGYKAIITRSSNNYGPYQFPEKVIPLFITNALEGKPLPLYGDGKNVRDWIYVEDNCEAIDLVLRKGKPGEIYNIGGQCERQNIEITKTILSELGKPESLIKHVKDRPGHDRRYALDVSKIKKELGWEPLYTFEQGIRKTIRWYQDNREWWKRVKSGEYLKYYKKHYG